MPRFTPDDIDIDADEWYESASTRERDAMWELIKDDYHDTTIDTPSPATLGEELFQEKLHELANRYYSLSQTEIDTIMKL